MTDQELQSTVRRLADKDSIRDLASVYAHSVWQHDIDTAIDLFTDDGEFDAGEFGCYRGRAELTEAYNRMLDGPLMHPYVHNHVIELDGDRATGWAYLDLYAAVDGTSMIGAGYYEDDYVRDDERWRFRKRKLVMRFYAPLDKGWA